MIRLGLFLFTIFLSVAGCGPSKRAVTQSRVETLAREWGETKVRFLERGRTSERDAWDNAISWERTTGVGSCLLVVRSNGPDGLPYTRDDVVARHCHPIPGELTRNLRAGSEAMGHGGARGVVKGVKEGLKTKKDKPERERE
jgi:hypothetical protein